MTFKELEAICIKNVASNGDTGFNSETIDDNASNPIYADYINNVDIHINSAIARLVTAEKLDLITSQAIEFTYDSSNYTKDKIKVEHGIGGYKVKRVYFIDDTYGNYYVLSFNVLDKYTILVKNPRKNGNIYIMYLASISSLSHDVDADKDMTTYGVNDTLCYSYILNYTKAKLWEAEEPELAQTYMNYAETFLAQYDSDTDGLTQYEVENEFTYY